MARKQAKPIDYGSQVSSDLVWLAQVDQDRQAIDELLTRITPVAKRIAGNYCRRYAWLDPEDIIQDLFADKLMQIIGRYRPGRATDWEKYAYHRITYAVKDILRCEDPLGISYPQKKAYPEWHRLGDEAFDGFEVVGRKELDADELDLLKLHESISNWRESFAGCKSVAGGKIKPWVSGDQHATGWCDGKLIGQFDYRRKFLKRVSLRTWIAVRAKPKQLALF
jgi:DNA-directed RNA polymerase specialized sigma24 family protein